MATTRLCSSDYGSASVVSPFRKLESIRGLRISTVAALRHGGGAKLPTRRNYLPRQHVGGYRTLCERHDGERHEFRRIVQAEPAALG
jgi:hypothetical protein